MKCLSRKELLSGNYNYPTDLITLKPTLHFKERLEERGLDLDCVPTMVRITKDNIHSGKTVDSKNLCSVVIRILYFKKYMFICFNPFDAAAKSIWFGKKK